MRDSVGSVSVGFDDGTVVELPGEATIGTSGACTLRVAEDYVAGVHLELSPREGGIHVIARGGELRVDGRSCAEAVARRGQRWRLTPFLEVSVIDVAPPGVEFGATKGRRWRPREGRVEINFGRDVWIVTGLPATLLAALLGAPDHAMPIDALIAAIWPGDRAAPDALRDRFDNVKKRLNEQLAAMGRREELVTVGGGIVRLAWGRDDRVD